MLVRSTPDETPCFVDQALERELDQQSSSGSTATTSGRGRSPSCATPAPECIQFAHNGDDLGPNDDPTVLSTRVRRNVG
jgi:hypothetical protein